MRPSRVALLPAAVAVLALAACSSGHGSSGHGSSATITARPAAGAGTTVASEAKIVSLTGPPAPPLCNAPTQVELHWVTRDASFVTLQIDDGPVFARYPDGKRDELVPLACDGNPQTYVLTAHAANGTTTTRSLTINERESLAS